jgi:hypothetical protein
MLPVVVAEPLPTSSWLNLVEGWFRQLTDRRLRPGTFNSVADQAAAARSTPLLPGLLAVARASQVVVARAPVEVSEGDRDGKAR